MLTKWFEESHGADSVAAAPPLAKKPKPSDEGGPSEAEAAAPRGTYLACPFKEREHSNQMKRLPEHHHRPL